MIKINDMNAPIFCPMAHFCNLQFDKKCDAYKWENCIILKKLLNFLKSELENE